MNWNSLKINFFIGGIIVWKFLKLDLGKLLYYFCCLLCGVDFILGVEGLDGSRGYS